LTDDKRETLISTQEIGVETKTEDKPDEKEKNN
jgi:hypothetical protein